MHFRRSHTLFVVFVHFFAVNHSLWTNMSDRIIPLSKYRWLRVTLLFITITSGWNSCRVVGNRGVRVWSPPPHFGEPVYPILTRRTDYAHHITTWIFRPFLRLCNVYKSGTAFSLRPCFIRKIKSLFPWAHCIPFLAQKFLTDRSQWIGI